MKLCIFCQHCSFAAMREQRCVNDTCSDMVGGIMCHHPRGPYLDQPETREELAATLATAETCQYYTQVVADTTDTETN